MNIMIIDRLGNKKLWKNIDNVYSAGERLELERGTTTKTRKTVAIYIISNLIGWYEVEDSKIEIEEMLIRLGK